MKLKLNLKDQTVKQAIKVFHNLGMSLDSAVALFLKQSVRDNALPFTAKHYPKSLDKANQRAAHLYDYIQRKASPGNVYFIKTNQQLFTIFIHVKNEIHLIYHEMPNKYQKLIQSDLKIARIPRETVFDDYNSLALQFCCELYARRHAYPLYTGIEIMYKKDPLVVISGSVLSGKSTLKYRLHFKTNHQIVKNGLYRLVLANPKKHTKAHYALADKTSVMNVLNDLLENV